MRQALAESRNAVAVWITREIGLDKVIRTARELGIRTPLQPYITHGARGVGGAAAGAGGRLSRHGLGDPGGAPRHRARDRRLRRGALRGGPRRVSAEIRSAELSLIQEGLRGVVRLPDGTAHSLDSRDFPIPVMGKTGTTSDFRDALFVGSTYGPQGITVAVRIGFDDNRDAGSEGDRGPHGAADLPRDHAPRLQGPAGGAGAAVPPRDRGRDRQAISRCQANRDASPARADATAVTSAPVVPSRSSPRAFSLAAPTEPTSRPVACRPSRSGRLPRARLSGSSFYIVPSGKGRLDAGSWVQRQRLRL